MRLRFGPIPDDPGFEPEAGDWVRLKEPSFGRMLLLALPLSVLLVTGIWMAWGAVARLRGIEGEFGGAVTLATALSYLVAFVVPAPRARIAPCRRPARRRLERGHDAGVLAQDAHSVRVL